MPREAIKKLYYSIGEVSEATDLKQYVLRYWESEFPQLSPAKNRAGNRTYREKDIELVNFIKTLLYEKKYTIEGARQKLKELQESGLPLNVGSLEDQSHTIPVQRPPIVSEPVFKATETRSEVVGASTTDSDRYKKFLLNLKADLQELLKLIES
ncbi:MAG: MerR family transcriptional regulator [Candidatus Marinimicrobia bacterium]|nr:MerR family transcriptional regulator [Candidatus Neomarinimicrobiota bacterium]